MIEDRSMVVQPGESVVTRWIDGRHEYLAALALGRKRIFVAWREAEK